MRRFHFVQYLKCNKKKSRETLESVQFLTEIEYTQSNECEREIEKEKYVCVSFRFLFDLQSILSLRWRQP